MGIGMKRWGMGGFVAATIACAALAPAALSAVGGASTSGPETSGRSGAAAPASVVEAARGVLAAGAPGISVAFRDGRRPSASWSLRRGAGDVTDGAPIAPGASFRIGSVTKTYTATAVLSAVAEGRLSLDDTLEQWLPGAMPRLDEGAITVRMLLDHTGGVPDLRRSCSPTRSSSGRARSRPPTSSPRRGGCPRRGNPARRSPTATPTTGCWR